MLSRRETRQFTLAGVLVLAVLAGGCSASVTPLPDTAALPPRSSADSERARHAQAIKDLESRAAAQRADVAKAN